MKLQWSDKDLQDLRDFREALNAMEDKRLCYREYINYEGVCCSAGALAIWRGVPVETIERLFNSDTGIKTIGLSKETYTAIVNTNDKIKHIETQEERYIRMRKWVDEQLGETA